MSDEKWKCPKCGIENDAENAFCGDCGTKKPAIGIGMAGKAVQKSKELSKSGQENFEINQKQSGAELSKPKKKKSGCLKKIVVSQIVLLLLAIVALSIYLLVMAADLGSLDFALVDLCEDLSRHWGLPVGCDTAPETRHTNYFYAGLQWSYPTDRMTWKEAERYCRNLNEDGHSDWRLPTIYELWTLVNHRPEGVTDGGGICHQNFVSGYFSKIGERGDFWTSSTSKKSGIPLTVYFECGLAWVSGDDSYVRCVR